MTARCDEHGVSLPCAGCRADGLATPKPAERTPDARSLAAGDDNARGARNARRAAGLGVGMEEK